MWSAGSARRAAPGLGRVNRRSGSLVTGLESRVCGLSITLDFWLHACFAVFEILKDVGGQCLFKERFSSLKAAEAVLTLRLQLDFFFPPSSSLFPAWDLIQKVILGHLTSGWNNELAERSSYSPFDYPNRLRSPFSLKATRVCAMFALKKCAQKNFGMS